MYFNSMQIGDTIRVVKNTKCGHHDVTNKNPALEGRVARVCTPATNTPPTRTVCYPPLGEV